MDTPVGHDRNADQIAYWNGASGQHWTDRQASQDILLAPVSELLIERIKEKVAVDFDTARRLFTLICALHWKG